jgi:hypothetical protein
MKRSRGADDEWTSILSLRNLATFWTASDVEQLNSKWCLLPPDTYFLLIMSMGWDYVSKLRPPTGLVFVPHMFLHHIWVWSSHGMVLTGKTEELEENSVALPLCPRQISHGLNQARTEASALRGRRLTPWAMARPNAYLNRNNEAIRNYKCGIINTKFNHYEIQSLVFVNYFS